MNSKTPKHGGARPGSGRKRRDTKTVGWHLRLSTIREVKAAANRQGRTPGELADQILSDFFLIRKVLGKKK